MLHNADVLDPAVLTVAERLQAAGFATAAFADNFYIDSRYGFDQGFDTYTEPKGGFDPQLVSFAQIQRRADSVVSDAIERARSIQREAATPGRSCVVEAAAGSGKTKVLVDRFLRLCLTGGADPPRPLRGGIRRCRA